MARMALRARSSLQSAASSDSWRDGENSTLQRYPRVMPVLGWPAS
jgi:hypothetical protein